MPISMPAADSATLERRQEIVAALKRIVPDGVIDDALVQAKDR